MVLMLGAMIGGLVTLERRKVRALTSQNPHGWAQHVHQLRASRQEIVTAFEIERRRIERDLHDGAQQYFVAAALLIGEASFVLQAKPAIARGEAAGHGMEAEPNYGTDAESRQLALDLLGRAQDATEAALTALRATVNGIHPAVLSDLGLEAAIRDLTDQSTAKLTVRVPHHLPAMSEPVAAAAYFLIAEAVTNITKHAPRAHATVLVSADEHLHVSVVDDGPGGATLTTGHGLAGMSERLDAFGGTLTVSSPVGGPTALTARIPLLLPDGHSGITLPPLMNGAGR